MFEFIDENSFIDFFCRSLYIKVNKIGIMIYIIIYTIFFYKKKQS